MDYSEPPFKDFVQIGAVVRDIEQSIRVLSEVFGIGPFRVIRWPPPDRPDMVELYRGKPSGGVALKAFAELGPVELELIQPIEGESTWADFLAKHGPGIHHIRFNVPQLEPVIEYLASHGFEVTQSGPGIRPGTFWAVIDTEESIGFAIEVMKALPGTDGRTPLIVDGKVQL